jgi:hypothetical protein
MVLTKVAFMCCQMEEATEIWLHTDKFSKDMGFPPSSELFMVPSYEGVIME